MGSWFKGRLMRGVPEWQVGSIFLNWDRHVAPCGFLLGFVARDGELWCAGEGEWNELEFGLPEWQVDSFF